MVQAYFTKPRRHYLVCLPLHKPYFKSPKFNSWNLEATFSCVFPSKIQL